MNKIIGILLSLLFILVLILLGTAESAPYPEPGIIVILGIGLFCWVTFSVVRFWQKHRNFTIRITDQAVLFWQKYGNTSSRV